MRIHLITVVGGHFAVLPQMLAHYRGLGIESIAINLHLRTESDPSREEALRMAREAGARIDTIFVGDWQSQQVGVWRASMQARADDWCVLADADELHRYPDALLALLAYCDRRGYSYLTGAFVDRLAADGGFPRVDPARPLGDQFPLGGFVTYPMLGADPRKIVAAKGRVPVSIGQHRALAGVACPIEEAFVRVDHYKWTAGLVDRLRARVSELRDRQVGHWTESERFVAYYSTHGGRIDRADPQFRIAICEPAYPHWAALTRMAAAARDQRLAAHSTNR